MRYALERRKNNRIKKLKKDGGGEVVAEGEMAAEVTNYFRGLFTSCAGTRTPEILQRVHSRVTPAMNEMLTKAYTAEEVYTALQSIGDFKAPGLDGMPAVFYKRYWDIVGDKVTTEVLQVLNGGKMPAAWNDTCMVLIPKVKTQNA